MNITCPSCSKQISELATHCPYCRAEIPTAAVPAATPRNDEGWPEGMPGWYRRHDQHNTFAYFDGKDFTGATIPAAVPLDTMQLVRGVAWGVVVGTAINGLIFWLAYLMVR